MTRDLLGQSQTRDVIEVWSMLTDHGRYREGSRFTARLGGLEKLQQKVHQISGKRNSLPWRSDPSYLLRCSAQASPNQTKRERK